MTNTDSKRRNWAVGNNMPGYMPEGEVWITSDWEAARDSLIDDLQRAADSDSMDLDRDVSDYESAIAELRAIAPNTEATVYAGDPQNAYFLNATDQAADDDEDTDATDRTAPGKLAGTSTDAFDFVADDGSQS
jgi:hypothetical protein